MSQSLQPAPDPPPDSNYATSPAFSNLTNEGASLPEFRGVIPPFLKRRSSTRNSISSNPAYSQPQSVPFFADLHPMPEALTSTVASDASIPYFSNSPFGNNIKTSEPDKKHTINYLPPPPPTLRTKPPRSNSASVSRKGPPRPPALSNALKHHPSMPEKSQIRPPISPRTPPISLLTLNNSAQPRPTNSSKPTNPPKSLKSKFPLKSEKAPVHPPRLPCPQLNKPTSSKTRSNNSIDPTQLLVDFDDVKNRIGIGTYGSVYVGCYRGELVAVKRIRMSPASSLQNQDTHLKAARKESLRQFAREIRRYQNISHPGIVNFLGVTIPEDGSAALLITSLMRGGSLGETLTSLRQEKTSMHFPSVVRVILQACGGLRALHSVNCTWGDAKPDNILLSASFEDGAFPSDECARISDFGLSRSVGHSLLGETTVAGSGEPAGTYNYMAPEAFAGINREKDLVAKASDIFSLGMVMYEMLTLRIPWKKHHMLDVCSMVVNGKRPEWPIEGDEDYYGPIPEDLRLAVESCWSHNPHHRPTAEQLIRRLEQTSQGSSELNGHRPVSDIADFPVQAQSFILTGDAQRALSRDSNASSVVPFGDESPNLTDSDLDGPNSAMVDESAVSKDPNVRYYPRVSPLTSPEPKSLVSRRNSGFTDEGSGANPLRFSIFSNGARLKQQPKLYKKDEKILPSRSDDDEILDDFMQEDIHAVPTTEFIQYRHEIAQRVADAAAQISNIEDSGPSSKGEFRDDAGSSRVGGFSPSRKCNEVLAPDLTSSTASVASVRRKRSKRLQSIIEHAAMAFLEIQRREDAENRIPPKLRKEAAERKAHEEAKQLSEMQTLKIMEKAQDKQDYSAALDALRKNRRSQVIVKAACSHLEKFFRDENLYFDLCEEGGVEEFVSAVSLFGKDDAELCTVFCKSMTYLSNHMDDKIGHLIRGVGVPSTVIELLEYHKTAVLLQTAGCYCLAAIAGSSELSRSAVATLGGPCAVYRAITKNNSSFKDVELAKATLNAIRFIAQDNEKAAAYLVEVAALDPVSRSADVFTNHGLEQDILNALQAFSFYNCGRRNIIMSSGLKAVTEIMLRNRDPAFLVQCCTFIRAIARWRNQECEEAILQSNVSQRVSSLLRMSNDIPGEEGAKVAYYACQACTFLASFGSRSRQQLCLVGAIETTISVLSQRRENPRVVISTMDAIGELIKNEPENKINAQHHDIVVLVLDSIRIHDKFPKVKAALFKVLQHLEIEDGVILDPAGGAAAYQEIRSLEAKKAQRAEVKAAAGNQRRWFPGFSRKKNRT